MSRRSLAESSAELQKAVAELRHTVFAAFEPFLRRLTDRFGKRLP